ncbi:retention module-containing protein, partial [Pseudomonas sp. SMN11]
MSTVVAIVKSIVGQVIAVSPEGIRRVLIEGDRLFAGEQVLTGVGGAVTLQLTDGRYVDLGRDSQWSASASDHSTDMCMATAQTAPSVEQLQQAIQAGADPTTALEATAAGPNSSGSSGGGALGGGHSFVLLEETAARVDPNIGFQTGPLNFSESLNFDFTAGPQTATTAVVAELATAVVLSATPSISEAGGSIVYVATVGQAPLSALTVTLSNGAVIVIAAGQTSGSVSVPVTPGTTAYAEDRHVSTSITGTSGGGIPVAIDGTPADTRVVGTVDTTTATLSASPNVTEGGAITYTVTLSNPAQTPVTVTLSNGQVISIGAGQSSGSVVLQTANDVYKDTTTLSTHITSVTGGNFEHLEANPAPVLTVVSDSTDTSTVTLTATPSVAEGGTIVYTASLSAPVTGTPVVVTLANGQTITVAVGQSSGTVSVPVGNDVYQGQGQGQINTSISGVSGGNFESLVANPTPVSTTVSDIQDVTTVSLSASSSVAEGGQIIYTATLSNPGQTAVTVTLSNGQSITIAANQTSGSVSVAAPADDHYADASLISARITSATGGNFESLAVNGTPAVTSVIDTLDTTTVTLTATPSVVEGGTIIYTATVNAPVTGSPVVVTLANGQSITIAVGQNSGTTTAAVSNDVYQGHAPVSNNITGVSGGNYEQLVANPTPVSTSVTDVQDTTTVTLTATPSVAEGGTITYTASVDAPVTGSPVVVNLANGQTITIPVGQSSGTAVAAVSNDAYQGYAPVTNNITSVSGGSYENLVANTATVSTAISDVTDTTTVTLAATPSVAEGGTILYTATMDAPVTGSPVIINLANGQTITIAVGQSSGTATGFASNDVYQGHATVTNSITTVTGGSYENLVADQTSVSTSVTDAQDTTTISLSATPSVAEGGQIVYTATLTNAAQSPVTVTLSNGQTVTIAANQTSGSVAVATHGETPYLDAGQVSVTMTSAWGGNFESLAINSTPAVTQVTDTVDTSTVSLTATPSVAEGGTIIYTATVTAPVTGSAVVVTLANGQTITIPVGQSSGTATAVVSNDVYQGHPAVTNSIANISGGNYENLVADKTLVSTTVTDVQDTTTVTLTATPTVAEGGTIVYTATVDAPVTGNPVVVNLANGQTITIGVGQSSGTTTGAVGNDLYQGHATVTNSITNVTGGNYENLVANQSPVSTTVTDVQDTTTVTLTATPSVVEGGTILYTASVGAPVTGSPVVVTLANGQTITILVGQSSGTATAAISNDVYQGHTAVSNSISNVSGGNYENLVADKSQVLTSVADVTDTTMVSLSATPSVAEGGQIVYTATLTNAAQSPVTVTLSNGQTITIPANQTSGSVAVATHGDNPYLDAGQVSASITSASGGNFENLSVNSTPAVTNVTDTVDTSTVSLTATPSVAEGGTIVYTATVTAPVMGSAVVVTLASGQTITIPVGQSSGTATAAVSNDVYQGHAAVSNSISNVSGGSYENLVADKSQVSTSVTDVTDTTTVTLTATPSVAEGGTIVYTASVGAPVTDSPVVVTLTNGQTITIAVGQSSGTATGLVGNDVYQGHAPVTNAISNVSGGNYENLVVNTATVSTTVTDVQDTSTVTLTATPSVAEGGTIVYTASVDAPVTGSPVVVSLANGQSITIAAGQSSGTITGAVDNDVYQGHAPVTNSITSVSGGNYENLVANTAIVSTTVSDVADTTTVTLTATPSVAEGGTILYTASVDAPVTGSPVVVNLANGQTITIAIGQSSGTATGAVSNDVYQGHAAVTNSITSVSGGNYENLVANYSPVSTTVNDVQDTTTVTLSATPSVTEGGTIVYTATVGAPVTGSPVVVSLANGQTITIPVGQSSGTATGAVSNDFYQGHAAVTNSISNVSGGNYENLVANQSLVSTSVTDVQDTTTVSLSATQTVAEGGQIVYTATLTNAAQSPVTVSLSNGQIITIAANQISGSVSVATHGDNPYLDAGQVSAQITNATGGNFENLAINSTPAVTNVTDTVDTSTVSLTATPSVAEGGTIVYTATVTAPVTGSAVVVTLANGQSITIPVGQSSGTATAAVSNDVYQGHPAVTNSISNVSGGNYENLVADKTQVSTTVTDVQDTTTVTLTATPSVAEGGTIIYTATVNAPVIGNPVVVNLANGQTITIGAGQSSGTATGAVGNDVYQGHAAVTNSITSVSGGNYENLVANHATVSTSVTDAQDTTTVSLSATPSVAEGGQIVYTATLTNAAQTAVSVTLSNGQTITIGANQTSGSVAVATHGDNPYLDAGQVTAQITGVSGGNFESLAVNSAPAVTNVTDTVDTSTVSLTATPSVAEGGTIVYTATVTAPVTGSAVVVTLANGQTITIPVGQSSGTATGTVSNDVYQGHATVTNSITSVSGGNYENLVADKTQVSTSVADVQDTTTVSLSATPSVAEGGQIFYTATLTNAAQSPVTVTLSNGQTITIGANQTSGSVAVATHGDNPYLDAGQVSAQITSASGGNFENLVVNSTPAVTNVTDTVDTSTVSLTATPSVAEGGTIVYTATVTAPVIGSAVVVTLANGQTITIPVGQSSGTATAAVSNDVYQGHPAVSNSISDVSGGNYENLVADKTQVSTTITDVQDTTTVTLTATPSVAEGGTIVYTASVDAPVTGSPVVVSLANGQSITIAVGQSSGTTTGAVSNDVYQGHAAVSNSITSVSGGNYENLVANQSPVSTSVTDVQDTTTVSLSATQTVGEGGQIVYTATLTNAAQSPVTVTLSNGQTIIIGANQTSGSVAVATHGDNPYLDAGQISAQITSASGGNFENLVVNSTPAVTNVTDTVDTSTVSLTATPSVAEGGTIVYTATVTAPVTGSAVVVTLANGQTITIPVGQSSGTATAAVSNDVYQGHPAVNNSISDVSGGNYENMVADKTQVSTIVTDVTDTTTVTLTATPSVAEGGTILYTASMGAPVTGSPVVVSLANGQTITIAVGESSGTATAAVSNDVYQGHVPVTNNITAVSGGNYESLVANSATVSTTVTDVTDTTTVTLTATPSIAEGGSILYTATVGSPVTGSPVVVNLSNGQTITIPVGLSSGTTTGTVSNDVYQGHAAVTNSISNVSGGNYENLVADKTQVSTSVTDVQDTTTVSLSATPSVAEGGQIVYTATLTNAAQSQVTVTLSNGQTIIIAAYQTSGNVAVATHGDNPYLDAGQVSASITHTSGGNFENLAVNSTPAVTNVTDTVDTSTVSLTATPSVAEGGTIVYTATVTAPVTGSAVVVTLANGQTITIPIGQSSGTATAAVSNDVYQGHPAVSNSISSLSGGNYEDLVADKTQVSTTVTDVTDTTTVTLTATPSVAEGGTITYTASVGAPVTGSPVVVSLANGQTITIAEGQSSGTATAVVTNDVYQGHAPVTNNITAVSGGNYESLVASTATVSTTVTDVQDTTTVSLSATQTVAEGGQIVYIATLTNAAQSPVTVTLSNGQSITIAANQTSGSVAVATHGDNPYLDAGQVSVSITHASGGSFENLAVNSTPAVTSVTDTVDTSTVSLTATPSVAEGGTIVYTATVTAPVTGSAVVVTLTNGQTITIPVGQSSGTATATVSNDAYQGHPAVTNSISNVSGGNYENLVADKTLVSTTVTDVQDTTTVSLSANQTVAEGGQIVYTATLTNAAQSPVTVTLSNGQTITIAANQTSGSVAVATHGDNPYLDAGPVSASITSVSGGNFENLAVNSTPAVTNVTDTVDTSTVSLTATPSVAEGGTIVYTATVTAPVTGSAVVVTLANGQSITIPVGQSSGTATAAVSNDVYQGHAAVNNSISDVSGGNYENLVVDKTQVSTTITDVQDTTTVTLTATPSVAEGGTIVYTASVDAPVTGSPIVVNLANGQTISIGVGQSSGTATGAVSNDVYQGHAAVTNSITTVTGGNYENLVANYSPVSTTVTDVQDTTTVTLTATPSVTEGGTIVYTATVGAPVTGTAVVVTLANGQSITIPVGQSSGTATAAVSNDVYQGHPAVSNSISNVSGGNYENLVADKSEVSTSVSDVMDTTTVNLTATPTVAEGGTIVYTATVVAPVTGSAVVVTLTNGQTITIPVGQSSGTATATVSNDVYQGHPAVSNSISNVSGGNYENLMANKAAVSTTVTDVQDTTTVTLTATPSVAEGGTILYTASVGAPVTGSPVVVNLANGQTITIAVGQSSGTATGAVSNDVYLGHASITNNITSVTGGNYENLVANQTPVSTSVTDVQDTTTVSLSATQTVAEGGQIVYTATLTNAAQSPVTVTLSNGQTITIAANQTSGSVAVATHGDNPYLDAGQVSAQITNATGGNFENLAINSTPAVTNVTDTVDTSTVSLTATPSVAEGGTIVYTATVTAPVTGSAVVVTLANGQTITIPVGQSSGTATAAVSNDVYQGHPAVSNSITNASGGNFENLGVNSTPAVTNVTDNVDTTTVTLTATPSVAEGGTIIYTATVGSPVTGNPVVVSLANGQTITIPVGQSSGTATGAVSNDVYQGHAAVTNSITSVSGGNYENLVANQAPVSTSVTDVQDTTTVSLSATQTVAEGGQIVYTATLTNAAQSPVTVTLSNGPSISIAANQTSGSVAVAIHGDNPYLDAGQVSASITSASGGNFENL